MRNSAMGKRAKLKAPQPANRDRGTEMSDYVCKAPGCAAPSAVRGGYCCPCGIRITGPPYYPQPKCRLCSGFLDNASEGRQGVHAGCERNQQYHYYHGLPGAYSGGSPGKTCTVS